MSNDLKEKRTLLRLFSMGLILLLLACSGCASTPKEVAQSPEIVSPRVEAISVQSVNADETRVEIVGSQPLPYTDFSLTDPPRVIVDVVGLLGPDVPQKQVVTDGNVKEISMLEETSNKNATRVLVSLARTMDYTITQEGNALVMSLHSPQPTASEKQVPASESEEPAQPETTAADNQSPSNPRIFFKPGSKQQVQILGVDFAMLNGGKSRLTVTTSSKGTYELNRVGPKAIRLNLENATIPPLLMRRLDTTYFEGAIDRVKANFLPEKKRVTLDLTMREMVPFHVDQTDTAILVDFGKTRIGPRQKKLVPLALAEGGQTRTVPASASSRMINPSSGNSMTRMTKRHAIGRKYTGAPMTMDFVNADVTNILRLIGEVSNLNIIWGPEVKGKVSMRLRKVPWDQALDLVLANNDLGMRRQGNVIWIATRKKIDSIEAQEKKKREQEEAERKKRLQAAEEHKKLEPLVTEYLTVNYVDVKAISDLIKENVKGPRGKISIDTANKTIIMTDTAANIKAAKDLKARQDKPIKQVMIEARIVEARTSFSRELGVNWGTTYQTNNNPWGGSDDGTYTYGFSTNFSIPSATTLGMNFVNTAATKLLNAQLALAETEGEVKTLSAPKIVTRDTVKATIKQGSKIVIPSGTDANGNTSFQQVDATLKLEVTPRITPNDMVIMNIDVSDDFPDYANARGDNVPINTKNAQTEMMIASGDTVVIGGIYKENKSTTEEGTPWLRNVPILGWLFKTNSKNDSRSELLIFLTPTVVSLPGRM